MSNERNDGGPAFPFATVDGHLCLGMALRDYFAANAMQSLIVAEATHTSCLDGDKIVSAAFGIADAMIKARQS